MALVYAILAIACLLSYFAGKYSYFLLIYYALMSHLLMLDTSGVESVGRDFCILINISITSFLLVKKRVSIYGKFDKFIVFFLLFYLLEFVITILLGIEGVAFGIKAIRGVLILLFYFVCKTIPVTSLSSFLKTALVITIIQGLLYLLQFANIHMLYGYSPEKYDLFGYNLNIPVLTIPFIFVSMGWNYVRRFRLLIILFLSFLVLLTGSRAAILSVCIGLLFCLFIDRKRIGRKKMLGLIVGAVLLMPIATKVIVDKSAKQGDSSVVSEIGSMISNPSVLLDFQHGSGSFVFRIAMLIERWKYLSDNPQYLLFGVGTIHEDSPTSHRRFDFVLGTRNEKRENGICQIESGDITWVPVSLRFGAIGTIIHILFFIIVFSLSLKRTDFLKYIAPLYLCFFLLSFDGPFFEEGTNYFVTCILMALSYYYDKKKYCTMRNKQVITSKAIN